MIKKQTILIIVLSISTAFLLFIVFFTVGLKLCWDRAADECNYRIELSDALNGLEEGLLDRCLDMWETYEYNCPNVYNGLLNNTIPIIRNDDAGKYSKALTTS